MSASQAKQPMSWDDYEYGRSFRQGSTGSLESHVQFREPSTPPGPSSRQNVTKQRSDGESAPGSLRHRGQAPDYSICPSMLTFTTAHGHQSRQESIPLLKPAAQTVLKTLRDLGPEQQRSTRYHSVNHPLSSLKMKSRTSVTKDLIHGRHRQSLDHF